MSKTLLLLILIFFLAVGSFFYVKYLFLNSTPPSLSHSSPSPTTIPKATLSFSPESLTAIPGEIAFVHIMLSSTATPPTIVQFELSYDPAVLTNIQLFPGNYFLNPKILLQNIDPKTGRISYALSSDTNPLQQNGNIATLTFIPYNASVLQTAIHLLPKSSIRGSEDTILTATSAAIIAIVAPQATPSAIMKNK